MFSMKRWQILLGMCLFIGAVAIVVQLLPTPAGAQMGNTAIPARCVPDTPDEVIAAGETEFFRCVGADGTTFGGGQSVPSGYYFLVTDIIMTPDRLTTVTTAHEVTLHDIAPNNNVIAELRLEVFNSESLNVNYTTPFLILASDHKIRGTHASMDSFGVSVYISGLLVTNLNYLPSLIRN